MKTCSNTRKPPHEDVYTRLRPSPIHGIGVFAIRKIKKGTYIFSNDEAPMRWVNAKTLKGLPREVRRLYEDFCVIKDGGKMYGGPKNFNVLTVGWYLNESKNPNVAADDKCEFYAVRDIKVDEELTLDYASFSEEPVKRK